MIRATNITKKFDEFIAVDNMTCVIPRGSIYGLIGANGSGKSTFVRMVTGVYNTDGGELTVDGESVYENIAIKAKMAYVPDELYFVGGATMNRMAKLYAGIYPKFDRAKFKELTDMFGLNPKKSIGTFSKGMKRQAATILALSCNPEYIFFDETFDGLDPVMRNLVKNLIAREVVENNATAIVTSHNLRELEDTCDQLALIYKGGVIFESDVQNLKTTMFKVQIAFADEYDRERFEQLDLQSFQKRGSVANFIVRGEREQVTAHLEAMNPTLIDILPLSLEEVFVHEMSIQGYSFKDILGDE